MAEFPTDDVLGVDKAEKIGRLTRDAMFHAIRGLNEINNQAQGYWKSFDVQDCKYQLDAAIGYLNQIQEVVERDAG